MKTIYYTEGYKYRVAEQFEVELIGCPRIEHFFDGRKISKPFAYIVNRNGRYFLVIEKGYAYDGATWAIDSLNFRRGSGVHDVGLELIGLGLLPADPWKFWFDNFLIKLCKEDGMWWPRRKWVYRAVRALGNPEGSKPKRIHSAP